MPGYGEDRRGSLDNASIPGNTVPEVGEHPDVDLNNANF